MDFKSYSLSKKTSLRHCLILAGFLFFLQTIPPLYALPKKQFDFTQLSSFHSFFTVTGGLSKITNPAPQTYFPEALCFYNYQPGHLNSRFLIGGTIGTELALSDYYLHAIDLGLSYYEPRIFNEKGRLSQGADIFSTSYYQYSYTIKSRQIMVESKFLFKVKNNILPYFSVGLGHAFNKTGSYHTTVPPFLEFTPVFLNHKQSYFSYMLGTGIDLILGKTGFRLGAGYRYSDLGSANLGGGQLDNLRIPFTLGQHLYSNQFILQASYVLPY